LARRPNLAIEPVSLGERAIGRFMGRRGLTRKLAVRVLGFAQLGGIVPAIATG